MSGIATKARRILKGAILRGLPGMITCVEFEDFIIEYTEDTLSPAQRAKFLFHMRICRECREFLEAYQRARVLAKASMLTADADLPEVPEELVTAILAARSADEQ